jgi:hypothetical protein
VAGFTLTTASYSSVGIATHYGLEGPGFQPGGGEIFHTRIDRPRGRKSLLYDGYRICFQEVKRPGHDVNHPPPAPSNAAVGTVELHPYSSRPSRPVIGRTEFVSCVCMVTLSYIPSTKQELTEARGGNILCFSVFIHIDNCSSFVMKTLSIWYAIITIWRRCENLALGTKTKLNSVALVRERTIPTEQPPPVGEVSANFCG